VTERTRIRRSPDRAVHERGVLDAILDAGFVAHVGIVDSGQPYVLPTAYARRGDQVILHGSAASRLFRRLAQGVPACVTVTLLDGFVYARSAFESSMNYRSVMLLGEAVTLNGDDELDALRVLSDHLLPGRWADVRHPSHKERAATLTVAVPIVEWSVKVRAGDPEDLAEDLANPPWSALWAGALPIEQHFGTPVPDQHVAAFQQVPSVIAHRTMP
jgi:nitroimidazol reductase NimA-like FMN-containing flavoprotein (pyridoxamine 5'-phosphate oxidase superfamily)